MSINASQMLYQVCLSHPYIHELTSKDYYQDQWPSKTKLSFIKTIKENLIISGLLSQVSFSKNDS